MHIFAETKSVGEHNKERLIESDSPLYPLYIINKIDTPPKWNPNNVHKKLLT